MGWGLQLQQTSPDIFTTLKRPSLLIYLKVLLSHPLPRATAPANQQQQKHENYYFNYTDVFVHRAFCDFHFSMDLTDEEKQKKKLKQTH